jgi:hypothetical protein
MLFHDMRRTAARNLRRAGLGDVEAMQITGHKTSSIFRRYSIVAESDLRDAVLRAQAFVLSERTVKRAKSVPNEATEEAQPVSAGLPSNRKYNKLRSVRP